MDKIFSFIHNPLYVNLLCFLGHPKNDQKTIIGFIPQAARSSARKNPPEALTRKGYAGGYPVTCVTTLPQTVFAPSSLM
jgi:hypothetical protein